MQIRSGAAECCSAAANSGDRAIEQADWSAVDSLLTRRSDIPGLGSPMAASPT
jgi:hypothetical protein